MLQENVHFPKSMYQDRISSEFAGMQALDQKQLNVTSCIPSHNAFAERLELHYSLCRMNERRGNNREIQFPFWKLENQLTKNSLREFPVQ